MHHARLDFTMESGVLDTDSRRPPDQISEGLHPRKSLVEGSLPEAVKAAGLCSCAGLPPVTSSAATSVRHLRH